MTKKTFFCCKTLTKKFFWGTFELSIFILFIRFEKEKMEKRKKVKTTINLTLDVRKVFFSSSTYIRWESFEGGFCVCSQMPKIKSISDCLDKNDRHPKKLLANTLCQKVPAEWYRVNFAAPFFSIKRKSLYFFNYVEFKREKKSHQTEKSSKTNLSTVNLDSSSFNFPER